MINCEAISEFKVFKTVKLRTGIDGDGYRRAIKQSKIGISEYADQILGKKEFLVVTKEIKLDLVDISVAELGFNNGVSLKKIFARAKAMGLQLCPNQVGPELRLQYKDQSNGELIIGMKPIVDSDGFINLFDIECDSSGLWLTTDYARLVNFWSCDSRFIFVLPRK